ncbi:hypothetical protein NQ315_005724 [Exocentrus adspersus]|uniref:THAP-type domain-containing protein n=1 Tax=Exocentrus adspersus TaxID=1586481 RepID=A0AAV8VJ42_9CUCU|nr:hypothetical protein NQ315_005724 [Exocentrus adspersus]
MDDIMVLFDASTVVGKLRYSCKYPSCKNAYYHPINDPQYGNKKFHRFPRDPDTLQIWKSSCNIKAELNNQSSNEKSNEKDNPFSVVNVLESYDAVMRSTNLINTDDFNEHTYCKPKPQNSPKLSKPIIDHSDKYSFLVENRKGMLGKLGLKKNDLSPREEIRNTCSKLSKLKSLLKNERAHINSLRNLYNDVWFQFIQENIK